MKLKRAIWIGVLAYIGSFIVGIITASVFGMDLESAVEAPTEVWVVGIVASILLMALFCLWYFKDNQIKPSLKEGFRFGIVAIIVAFVIESVLIVPFIILSGAPSDIYSYYANPLFWLTVALILITTSVVGKIKEK
jgi:hypothetical protein